MAVEPPRRGLVYPPRPVAVDDAAARGVAEFASSARDRQKWKPRSVGPAERARFLAGARSSFASGDWEQAGPGHLVALYGYCHERVYGVRVAELEEGRTYGEAMRKAAQLLKSDFAGDVAELVAFVRWTWRREDFREKKRRADGGAQDQRRLGWRLQFAAALVTDYRLDQARRRPT